MTYATTMTSKGQITLPAPIRKRLGFRPGDSVNVQLKGNTAVVTVNDWQAGLAKVRAELIAHLKAKGIKPPVTEEDFRQLRREAHEAAGEDRYRRYQRTLED